MKSRPCGVLSIVALILLCCWPAFADQQQDCFQSSLHKTGEGMRYWYEAEDGFMTLSGIPYDKLGCKNCHAKGCNDCHLNDPEQGQCYSLEAAKKDETCYRCHVRAKAVSKMIDAGATPDVHADAGMGCNDCHSSREMHGDGTAYSTMRDPAAKDASCANCHSKDSEDYPAVPDTKSHVVHNDKLDCNACHVQYTMTCYNCHFGEFARTKSKPDSFIGKVKDFLLLVKYQGKITSGNMQSLVSAEDEPFVVYAPYLTHAVMSDGRKCEECHATEAAITIASGKKHAMSEMKDGKTVFYKGVVPVAQDLLEWPFFKKTDGEWVQFKPESKTLVQMGLYSEPLSKDELNNLKVKQTYK